MVTTLDKFGRVVIPKALRDSLGLKPGEPLEVEERDEQIVLKSARKQAGMVLKGRVWVWSGGKMVGDPTRIVEEVRDERIRTVSGLKRP
jgi:AbrB family transcriptional regulator (stage V sporulation protein T)